MCCPGLASGAVRGGRTGPASTTSQISRAAAPIRRDLSTRRMVSFPAERCGPGKRGQAAVEALGDLVLAHAAGSQKMKMARDTARYISWPSLSARAIACFRGLTESPYPRPESSRGGSGTAGADILLFSRRRAGPAMGTSSIS